MKSSLLKFSRLSDSVKFHPSPQFCDFLAVQFVEFFAAFAIEFAAAEFTEAVEFTEFCKLPFAEFCPARNCASRHFRRLASLARYL